MKMLLKLSPPKSAPAGPNESDNGSWSVISNPPASATPGRRSATATTRARIDERMMASLSDERTSNARIALGRAAYIAGESLRLAAFDAQRSACGRLKVHDR